MITFYAKEGEKLLNHILALYPESEYMASSQKSATIGYYSHNTESSVRALVVKIV